MGRRGAAAPADRAHAELGHEPFKVVGELFGGQVVVHLAVDHRRETGIGEARDGHSAVRREVAQRFTHLRRTSGAVEADDVDLHGVERGERSTDLGARQHASGQLDGHLHLDRYLSIDLGHGAAAGVDGCLGAQEVEHGLDDQEIHPALEEPQGLLLVGAGEIRIGDLAKRREFGTRSHAPRDPARVLLS